MVHPVGVPSYAQGEVKFGTAAAGFCTAAGALLFAAASSPSGASTSMALAFVAANKFAAAARLT